MTDIERWVQHWRALGAGDSPTLRGLHRDVLARYSEPGRHYHTLQHLAECFAKVEDILPLAEHPAEVIIAIWLHDVIYDTHRHDNEERSADWASQAARELGVAVENGQRIHELILFTRHATEPVGSDAQVLVDADLAILGAEPARFLEYEAQIRSEYAWVPEFLYRPARAKILNQLLARPRIFSTTNFQEKYETRARSNLNTSLNGL